MQEIVAWVKNYSMVFLVMTMFTSMTSQKDYRKYIQFFVEVVLVIAFVSPFLNVTGRSEDFFDKISYDSFWQGLDSIKADQEKIEFLNEDYYVGYYEETIETDVTSMAEDAGYAVLEADVVMNEKFEIESITLEVAKQKENQIIIGTIDLLPEESEITSLREKIAGYYQLDISKVIVRD